MSPKVTEEHKESRRTEILEAAKRVFVRKGYQAVTMKDVVEESGLSRGGVYLYFGSTEEMLLAIVEQMDEENELDLDKAIQACGSVWKAVIMLFDQVEKEAESSMEAMLPVLLEFYSVEWRSGRHKSLIEARYNRICGLLEAFLQKGIDRGEFHPIVPVEAIARVVISFNDGMYMGSTQLGHIFAKTRMQLDTMITVLKHLLQVNETPEGRGESQ